MRVANAIGEACGEAEEWEGTVPGVNVVFYVPGSVMDHVSVTKIEAARFSRKRKLLLVNVPVPKEIVRDWNQSLLFLIDALCKANAIAAEVFGHKKGMEPFDLAKAEAIIDRVKEMLVEPENRDGLPQGG
ncbi:MAG TPA: hypothetical protein VHP11_04350 [Tepidisphaeraceae bacterium]|nr:hypothetical protein [Tepidisphaeraceae bacterium]